MVPDDVSLVQDDPPPVNLEEGGRGAGTLLLWLHTGSTLNLKLVLKILVVVLH